MVLMGRSKKMNDDGWHTILAAGVDRNILVYDGDATAGAELGAEPRGLFLGGTAHAARALEIIAAGHPVPGLLFAKDDGVE